MSEQSTTFSLPTLDGYGFSGVGIGSLGSTEYTLAVIAVDASGSVGTFRDGLEETLKAIIESCRTSPRADYLLVRVVTFNARLDEVHGFRPLDQCNPDDYTGTVRPAGITALYDAAINAAESIAKYGQTLYDQEYDVNGILFCITDGMDNASTMGAAAVKTTIQGALQAESLESLRPVLIGVNVTDPTVQQYLARLRAEAGFDQYVEMSNASPGTLAKLAKFVSQSISSQSQALGSGGPSKALTL